MELYKLDVDEALKTEGSNIAGLSMEEAVSRFSKYGPNRLTGRKKTPIIVKFFEQFLNPLVYILAAAASIKAFVKGPVDAMVIVGVILFMAIVGFIQEVKAEKAMDALMGLSSPKAKVRRSGKTELIDTEKVVPGDILVIDAGDKVPADARIIEAANLKVNEASLTGESLPVDKTAEPITKDAALSERKNMLYTSSSAVYGRAAAVVTATGMKTEIGKIAAAISDVKEEKTTLQKSIDGLGKNLIWIILLACCILVGLGFWRGLDTVDIFMIAIAAAVAAIPEGLPAVVTVVLASGMQRMARHNAIIRKLVAVETLGSTTVICSDKTGTLTMNQMTVKKIYVPGTFYDIGGAGYEPEGSFTFGGKDIDPSKEPGLELMLRAGVLCNDSTLTGAKGSRGIIGDPTEGALVVAAGKAGMLKEDMSESWPRTAELPFQSENQYMATAHEHEGAGYIFVKGALEKILPMARAVFVDGKEEPLSDAHRKALQDATLDMSKSAMRVLAGAYIKEKDMVKKISSGDLKDRLVIAGLFGMIDPPREEAKKAVMVCQGGGIKVVMATGDNPVTGGAVGEAIGLTGSIRLTGADLEGMTDEELASTVEDVSVFARIEPLHKLRIVKAFKSRGHIVAMTGDGVNDAPALETADIGVAMGITGTDVAKEASDMVLADDNFASIVTAVEEGRAIFNRLRNVILFLMVTCFGELLALMLGMSVVGEAPLVPLQILWVNLVTGALIAIPLGLEPVAGDELKSPPRKAGVGLLYRGMIARILFLGGMSGIGAFLVFLWALRHYEIHEARTMAFCAIVAGEWLISFNARNDERTIFGLGAFSNRWLIGAVLVGTALQMAVIYLPWAHKPFDTVPLKAFEWGFVLAPAVIIMSVETIRKLIAPRLFSSGKWGR